MTRLLKIAIISTAIATTSPSVGISQSNESQVNSFTQQVDEIVDGDAKRLQSIFQGIHQNPELGFMETRTAEVVARELGELGYQVTTGVGGTGVVGIFENGPGPVVMWRADMDANAIRELTGLPYASEVQTTNLEGEETYVAHMCGHDAHTTWLIGLAKVMRDMQESWSGTLVLVAQPAEEPIAGAQAMVDDGMYTTLGVPEPDVFMAFHTAPLPTGTFASTVGRVNTMSSMVDVTFHGVGGHGSSPHHAKDPIVMAGSAIMQLQTIVSRRIDPDKTAVVTIGAIEGGVDNNVIPTDATLKLKLHAESKAVHETLLHNIELIADGIASGSGVDEGAMPTLTRKGFASVVKNSEPLVIRAREILGAAHFVPGLVNDHTVAGSDDAFLLIDGIEKTKAAYFFVGTAEPGVFAKSWANGQFPFFVHEPYYVVDLEAIPVGTKMAALLALDALKK
ncbi:amidohydrolase [Rhodobacteraceae bacterium M382]|nr:amidohydrolase [Rhodobacteraceae bacterium M382]